MFCFSKNSFVVLERWAGPSSYCNLKLLVRHFSGWCVWECCAGLQDCFEKFSIHILFSRDKFMMNKPIKAEEGYHDLYIVFHHFIFFGWGHEAICQRWVWREQHIRFVFGSCSDDCDIFKFSEKWSNWVWTWYFEGMKPFAKGECRRNKDINFVFGSYSDDCDINEFSEKWSDWVWTWHFSS